MHTTGRGAVAGVLAAGAALGAAHLAAAALGSAADPLLSVGGTAVDAAPTPVKEFAVRAFGTHDKLILLLGIGIVLAVLAAAIGVLAVRRRRAGLVAAAALGVVGVVTALIRPAATPRDALPGMVAAVIAVVVVWSLTRAQPSGLNNLSRRRFLVTAGAVTAGAVAAGTGGQLLRVAATDRAARARGGVVLPRPTSPAAPLPAGTPTDFITPNARFYRVDTALIVPRVDPAAWRLTIHGMVDRPRTLDLTELLRRPMLERHTTLNCVSGEVGSPYVGTARWLGASLATLLREAGIRAGADQVVARSVDGMTIGTPVETILDGRDALLAVGMNAEPLPLEHGFPVRVLTPGLYGYAGACKWVTDIEVTTFAAFDAYWVKRGWAARAPVKTGSRIDRPAPFARPSAGPVIVAGVAWAQHRGVAGVEVQVDNDPWQVATLLPAPSSDTWTQWSYRWVATLGAHTLRVRSTDARGETQPQARTPPFPDGATGWHSVTVTVE